MVCLLQPPPSSPMPSCRDCPSPAREAQGSWTGRSLLPLRLCRSLLQAGSTQVDLWESWSCAKHCGKWGSWKSGAEHWDPIESFPKSVGVPPLLCLATQLWGDPNGLLVWKQLRLHGAHVRTSCFPLLLLHISGKESDTQTACLGLHSAVTVLPEWQSPTWARTRQIHGS